MIFRKSQTPEPPAPEPAPNSRPGSKGRPTRTRKEAEAANRRPLVVDDRKEARKRSRERANRERAEQQTALMTGDESKMPLQHRGPERRLVRDLVDTRRNLAEYFFPVALVVVLIALILPIVRQDALAATVNLVLLIALWGGIALCVIDAFILRRHLRRNLDQAHGEVKPGLVSYGIMRAVQIRRFRLPKPALKHGEQPR